MPNLVNASLLAQTTVRATLEKEDAPVMLKDDL
jgi:hypothetical protein